MTSTMYAFPSWCWFFPPYFYIHIWILLCLFNELKTHQQIILSCQFKMKLLDQSANAREWHFVPSLTEEHHSTHSPVGTLCFKVFQSWTAPGAATAPQSNLDSSGGGRGICLNYGSLPWLPYRPQHCPESPQLCALRSHLKIYSPAPLPTPKLMKEEIDQGDIFCTLWRDGAVSTLTLWAKEVECLVKFLWATLSLYYPQFRTAPEWHSWAGTCVLWPSGSLWILETKSEPWLILERLEMSIWQLNIQLPSLNRCKHFPGSWSCTMGTVTGQCCLSASIASLVLLTAKELLIHSIPLVENCIPKQRA